MAESFPCNSHSVLESKAEKLQTFLTQMYSSHYVPQYCHPYCYARTPHPPTQPLVPTNLLCILGCPSG
ncbi:hypothetical protein XENTR_v10000221 [Xenopus tropicalis]|nr:hypothetical protein XENTR_v10000221 [Xenopus tropicalis]